MSESDAKLLLCYNKGCSQKFEESKNNAEACLHHPGEPFFHDAYKGWSCCKKKCTDFTEFLNIKGCTRSFHNSVKPPEPEKPKVDRSKNNEIIICEAPKQPERLARPSVDTPTSPLKVVISPSLQQLLDKEAASPPVPIQAPVQEVLKIGTSCKNGACKVKYEGEGSNLTECVHHPGVPIFHEGLKYWSCCQRKTTEFSNFLDQQGCTSGKHLWIKPESDQKNVSCRYDWHQTGSFVFISIYAKGVNPSQTKIDASPVKLVISLKFSGDSVFEEEFVLRGIVETETSVVTMSATKVEIKLKKAEIMSWDKLSFPKEVKKEKKKKEKIVVETKRVENISLDDLEVRRTGDYGTYGKDAK